MTVTELLADMGRDDQLIVVYDSDDRELQIGEPWDIDLSEYRNKSVLSWWCEDNKLKIKLYI